MTEVEQPPQNGIDPKVVGEDENSKARPADIEQDMREMERRKRVEAIMGSKLFREELERIVDSAREGGAGDCGILQQLSDIVGVPVNRVSNVFKTSSCMVPIWSSYSLGYLLEEEELFRQGIWKKGDHSRWLNSFNVYQKVEETGTPDPKKITKWVAEDSPTHSTQVRIEDPLQFVPAGTTNKELKRVQQQDNRHGDKISAGQQSHILEGVTWDDANHIKDSIAPAAHQVIQIQTQQAPIPSQAEVVLSDGENVQLSTVSSKI